MHGVSRRGGERGGRLADGVTGWQRARVGVGCRCLCMHAAGACDGAPSSAGALVGAGAHISESRGGVWKGVVWCFGVCAAKAGTRRGSV